MMGCNMNEMRFLEIKQDIFGKNNDAAAAFRSARKEDGMLYIDVMASPGAGKTTLLLTIMAKLRERGSQDLAVIEADLESDVDALKIKEAGVDSVELNTRGVCHVELGMVEKAFAAFGSTSYEYLFLENIGNLVCSADFDTGAHVRVMLLSVPEGWDKVMKYPPLSLAPGRHAVFAFRTKPLTCATLWRCRPFLPTARNRAPSSRFLAADHSASIEAAVAASVFSR